MKSTKTISSHTVAKKPVIVSTESIFSVFAFDKKEIACHHLNYFIVQESLDALKTAIG